MRLNLPKVPTGNTPVEIDIGFDRIEAACLTVFQIETNFVSASAGAVSRYLPDGMNVGERMFVYVKTDASVNAVTIYPYGSQLIDAAASVALAAQGASVKLIFDTGNQTWWSI